MLLRVSLHRLYLVSQRAARRVESGRAGIVPAGVNVSETFDRVLIVSRNRLTTRIELDSAVIVQHHQSDRKQLHAFAGIVFVGANIQRHIRLLIAEHRQINAHGGMQRDVF